MQKKINCRAWSNSSICTFERVTSYTCNWNLFEKQSIGSGSLQPVPLNKPRGDEIWSVEDSSGASSGGQPRKSPDQAERLAEALARTPEELASRLSCARNSTFYFLSLSFKPINLSHACFSRPGTLIVEIKIRPGTTNWLWDSKSWLAAMRRLRFVRDLSTCFELLFLCAYRGLDLRPCAQ